MARTAGTFGVLAMISASLLLLPLPAHADEIDGNAGTITIQVQIDPIECVTACGGGSLPGTDLPATGMSSIEPFLWIAIALLVGGALFALRARATRHSTPLSRSAPSTAYAVVSGERAPAGDHPSPARTTMRRTTERGDRA